MLFNSFDYILFFLPIVAIAYAVLQKYCGQSWAQGRCSQPPCSSITGPPSPLMSYCWPAPSSSTGKSRA
jgi:hypothetical protein